MRSLTVVLQDATHSERFDDVATFVGSDPSGSFGLLPGHERLIAVLNEGLARFRRTDGTWWYVALPGGILHLYDDVLTVSTRRYLVDDRYDRIADRLREQLLDEERKLVATRASLRTLEEAMLKRLWRGGADIVR